MGSIGSEKLTVTNSAGGTVLTSSVYETSRKAFISVEVAPVRFAFNAIPTATTGILLKVGDELELETPKEIGNFKVIATSSNAATLNVLYTD